MNEQAKNAKACRAIAITDDQGGVLMFSETPDRKRITVTDTQGISLLSLTGTQVEYVRFALGYELDVEDDSTPADNEPTPMEAVAEDLPL